MNGLKDVALGILLCVVAGSGAILIDASKADGAYKYNFSVVVLLAEGCKLLISSILLLREFKLRRLSTKVTTNLTGSLRYLVPSVLYSLQNNIQFLILRHVDPTTYEVFRNINVIVTACFSHTLLRRRLTFVQWTSLIILTCGVTASQVSCSFDDADHKVYGAVWAVASATLSALTGIYMEVIMKATDDSIHWQNIQLYAYGILCNLLLVTLQDAWRVDSVNRGGQASLFFSPFKNFGASTVSQLQICPLQSPKLTRLHAHLAVSDCDALYVFRASCIRNIEVF